jgi:hypothetical protein
MLLGYVLSDDKKDLNSRINDNFVPIFYYLEGN